ncbi:MAG: O-sialoglycoprotein endopeptidase [Clostridia bacterium]|nr:O-sialoglycoprotein endopeptidase [Clostridia bacterium]
MDLYLGIDTSNYTTSVAVVDASGHLVADERKMLEVKKGAVGLRQSEAVFQHMKNLPLLLERVFNKIDTTKVRVVAASGKPRPVAGSYMPVFLAGLNTAKILAGAWGIPLVQTTHQEGHIMAGLWSVGGVIWEKFCALHISGGTTEVLEVTVENTKPLRFNIVKIGGTEDLHAGQFIDRIGVRLGLPFPSGPSLEKLAEESLEAIEFPFSVRGLTMSFSGPESHGRRLIEKGVEKSQIARGVENCLIKTLEKVILNTYDIYNYTNFLLVGGVANNKYLRTNLISNLKKNNEKICLLFASPPYSSDNAVGTSMIAKSRNGGYSHDV